MKKASIVTSGAFFGDKGTTRAQARQRLRAGLGHLVRSHRGSPVTHTGTLQCSEINHILITLAEPRRCWGCDVGNSDGMWSWTKGQEGQERAPISSPAPLSHPRDAGGWLEAGKASSQSPRAALSCSIPFTSPRLRARGPRMYIYLSDILKMSPRSER